MNKLSWRIIILLLMGASGFFWLGNWKTSLYDRDEPRFAQPAKEMLFAQSWKDWVVPHFNGEPFFHKPPLSYWQMALAYNAFGVNEFSARFFSGFWTALTAVVIAVFLTRRYSVLTGLAAAAAFCTSLMVISEAKLATADATLGLLSILAVFSLWDIYRDTATFGTRLILWLATGVAVICKGPTIFFLLVGLVGTLLIIGRDRKWILKTGFWWGLPLVLIVGLPWYILSERLSGGAMSQRFWQYDILKRIFQPLESHRGFPGFYVLTALIDAWPWSAFLVPLAAFVWRNRGDKSIKFLLAWLLGPTIILECMATKMVHYWLIVLPAYVILLALAIDRWAADPEFWKRWKRPVLGTVGVVWIILAMVVLVVKVKYVGLNSPDLFILAGGLIGAVVYLYRALRKEDLWSGFFAMTLTTLLIVAVICLFVLPALEKYKLGRQVARLMNSMGNSQTTYALIGWKEPSTVFYLHSGNRPVILTYPESFGSLLAQPNTVVGVLDKNFEPIKIAFPNAQFFGIDGFDYTRGRNASVFVTRSAP